MKNKVSLGDIAHIYSGGTPSRTNPEYWRGNIPWVKTTLIQNCIIKPNDVDEWITEEGFKKSSAKLVPEGSILMAMIGQGKTRGQVAVLDFEATTNQNAAAIVLKPNNDSSFVYQQLLFRYKAIRNISNASGQQNLNLEIIRTIKLPEIGYPEQKAIAGVLSKWDWAIFTTERLIQAKEKRFKWLANKLINEGSKNSSWRKVKLGAVCTIKTGKKDVNEGAENGEYPFFTCAKEPTRSNDYSFDTTAILIAGNGNIGNPQLHSGKFEAYQRTYILSKFEKTDPQYLVQYLGDKLQRQIDKERQHGAMPYIKLKTLSHFPVMLPPLPEQKEIAETLNTAQREIALLKKLTDKYKEQKRGLMQKLLTGMWRVKQEM